MNVTETIETIGQDVRHTGRNLWLVGLGAAASIEQGSRDVFDTLVARGRARQPEGFDSVADTLQETKAKVSDRVRGIKKEAEDRLEEKVSAAMKRLGVPVRQDFELLIDRIEQLSRKVDELVKA